MTFIMKLHELTVLEIIGTLLGVIAIMIVGTWLYEWIYPNRFNKKR